MHSDIFWELMKIAGAAIAGGLVTLLIERRARLITYYSHVAEFELAGTPRGRVHTHSVVIKNRGRAAAKNVKVPHAIPMQNIHVLPAVNYTPAPLPGGGEELVFSSIAPKQEITISYLYFPPLTFNQINQAITYDDGVAKFVPVYLAPLLTPFQRRFVIGMFFLGVITALYLLIEAGLYVSRAFGLLG